MADILSADKLDLFLFFVVPGFVSLKIYDALVPSARRNLSESFIEVITYSMFNMALWFWLVSWLNTSQIRASQTFLFYFLMFWVLFLSPVLLAFTSYKLLTSPLLRGIVVHPTPTPWDFFFGQRKSSWILFHLKSGQKVGGYYSSNSFTSSFPHPEEVYVEQLWLVDEKGSFKRQADRTGGAIIRADECDLIEFFK